MSTAISVPPLALADLRALSARSDLHGALRAASHCGAIVVGGGAIWWVAARWGLAWALPLIAVQGVLVAFLFMPLHETAHRTAFRSRAANLALGHLAAFAIGLPYEYYRLFHWEHHRHTQDPVRDPELVGRIIPSSDAKLAIAYTGLVQFLRRLALVFRHALAGRVTAPWVPEDQRGAVVREARIHVALHAAWILASLVLASPLLLWVWIVPLLAGQLALRPYLYAEHTGCAEARSAFENTRTTYTTALLRWFAWNMPYHVEHHAYPAVPFHALPRLNRLVAGRIAHAGAGYRAVTRETWAWFRRARYRAG